MSADAVNRETIRDALTTLFTNAMVPTHVSAVYGYEKSSIEVASAVMVLSGGSKRIPSGINDTRWRNEFHFEVLSFVRMANTLSTTTGGTNWTEADVEDKLDLIDKEIADVIADNRSNSNWSYIEFEEDYSSIVEGRSRAYDRDSQSIGYKIESRLLKVTYIEG